MSLVLVSSHWRSAVAGGQRSLEVNRSLFTGGSACPHVMHTAGLRAPCAVSAGQMRAVTGQMLGA